MDKVDKMVKFALFGPLIVVAGIFSAAVRTETPEAVLEGVVRCAARSPMVVYAEPHARLRLAPPAAPALIDQRGLEFVPHVLAVVVGTRVGFLNSDPVPHNVFSPSPTRPFNFGAYGAGVTRYATFDRPGVVEILCNVHLEMNAYIVVLRTRFFTLTREDGRYRIEGLSPGPHTVSVWCETAGTVQQEIQLGGGLTRLDFDLGRRSREDGRTRIEGQSETSQGESSVTTIRTGIPTG